MRIRTKIVAVYLIGLLLIIAIAAYSNHAGQQILMEDASRHSLHMARQLIKQIGHEMDRQIDRVASVAHDGMLEAFLAESNLRFAALKERDAYIARQEKIWRSPAGVHSIDTPASRTLQDRFAGFSEARYDKTPHPAILFTNR